MTQKVPISYFKVILQVISLLASSQRSLKPVVCKILKRMFWWLQQRIHQFWPSILILETCWVLAWFVQRNPQELYLCRFWVCAAVNIINLLNINRGENIPFICQYCRTQGKSNPYLNSTDWQDISVRGANISNSLDMSRGSPIEEGIPKQSFILICSEQAAYVYSLIHAIQVISTLFL